ncbi:hypothetical protein GGH12_000412 [Coemansia sp. RSA 1822]|nr:hypothetical protein LPJ76_002292 [Coemansia sp. RSA 638]KAJ2124639.1 hypothetical protein IW147_001604 [Coemansia sp. RSA 720]KAJ2543352.1 hypothetical protein GGF49_002137 [Coemansia sp. RSA 1853]KAJ2567299.1 hypothetical protein GGH12_000412 [Coemansia sp. RSA 1822]
MSSTDPSSRFISESAIDDARKERQDAWKKAYESGTVPPADPDYESRTLYEQLQEQRTKKSEAMAESRRFANQIRMLDDGETEFLDSIDEHEREQQLARKREEMAALAEFKDKVAERQQRPVGRALPKNQAKPLPNQTKLGSVRTSSILSKISGSVRRREQSTPIVEHTQAVEADDDGARKRQKSDGGSQLLSALASYASDSDSD